MQPSIMHLYTTTTSGQKQMKETRQLYSYNTADNKTPFDSEGVLLSAVHN